MDVGALHRYRPAEVPWWRWYRHLRAPRVLGSSGSLSAPSLCAPSAPCLRAPYAPSPARPPCRLRRAFRAVSTRPLRRLRAPSAQSPARLPRRLRAPSARPPRALRAAPSPRALRAVSVRPPRRLRALRALRALTPPRPFRIRGSEKGHRVLLFKKTLTSHTRHFEKNKQLCSVRCYRHSANNKLLAIAISAIRRRFAWRVKANSVLGFVVRQSSAPRTTPLSTTALPTPNAQHQHRDARIPRISRCQ